MDKERRKIKEQKIQLSVDEIKVMHMLFQFMLYQQFFDILLSPCMLVCMHVSVVVQIPNIKLLRFFLHFIKFSVTRIICFFIIFMIVIRGMQFFLIRLKAKRMKNSVVGFQICHNYSMCIHMNLQLWRYNQICFSF